MRFIHTADWHLGRKLGGHTLLAEQRDVLRQLLGYVGTHQPDALLLSGDVYDRAVPPPEAVALLDEVLNTLHALRVPVVVIAGNHDGAERLSFLRGLLRHQNVHVTGWPNVECAPVVLCDAFGDVHVHSVPFAEPVVVRARLNVDIPSSYEASLDVCLAPIRSAWRDDARHVLLAHAHVSGAKATPGAERRLSASGNETVPLSAFDGFHYVALGHLHEPQAVGGRGHVQYPGSPYKYSFDEAHDKGALLVDLDGDGQCRVERLPLHARRDVRRIEGTFEEILDAPKEFGATDDYLSVTLRDRTHVRDAIYKLRQCYPNVLEVKYLDLDTPRAASGERRDARVHTPLELFEDFYRNVHGLNLTFEDRAVLEGLLDEAAHQEREVRA